MDSVRKSYLRMGLFLLLAGVTISSAILYFASLKERYDLSLAVSKLKLQLSNLEEERRNLNDELESKKTLEAQLVQENAAFKENIQNAQEQVLALNSAFKSARLRVKSLSSKIQVLQDENQALSQERKDLSSELSEAVQERDALKSKFESVVELKKAIVDLRRRIYMAKREINKKTAPEEVAQLGPDLKEEEAIEGNRGFIIKDGKFTLPAYRIKIEVKPTFDTDSR